MWQIFFKLPSNSGHLSITDKFLRHVDVRYSEVSLYKVMKKPYLRKIISSSGRDCVLIVLF